MNGRCGNSISLQNAAGRSLVDDHIWKRSPKHPNMSLLKRIQSLASSLLGKKHESPLVSVVLLLRNPVPLSKTRIDSAVVEAWGRDPQTDKNEWVVYESRNGMIRFNDVILLTNNISTPYGSADFREKAIAEIKDLRQRKAVLEHRAWLSVDLMHPKDASPNAKQACYRQMCSLAASLMDDNCLAVSFPETGQFRVYDDYLNTALRSENPLEAVKRGTLVPVLSVEEENSELRATEQQARRHWPEFVEAFRKKEGEQFSVKASFREGDNVEWMWISVTSVKDDTIEGNLGNAPVNLHNVHEGDFVRVAISDIGDWCYTKGKDVIGGFSFKVVSDAG